MINAIDGGLSPFGGRVSAQPLSGEQKDQVGEILSNYDAGNLSAADAKEIVEQISELGVKPGLGLAGAIFEAGFSPKDIASQAGLLGEGGFARGALQGGDRTGRGPDEAILEIISDILQSDEGANEEEGDSFADTLAKRLEAAGYDTSNGMIDFYA